MFSEKMTKWFLNLFLFIIGTISGVALIFNGNVSYADTETGGIIALNTTWTLDKSPYVIVNNITLLNNATLTIEPGVVIKSKGYRSLNVEGRLIAKGSSENPIVFTSLRDVKYGGSGASSADWNGIWTYSSSQNSELENCLIRFAEKGIVLGPKAAPPKLKNVSLTNSRYAASMHITAQLTKDMALEIGKSVGNEYSGILLFGEISNNNTLKDYGVHYLIEGDVNITIGSALVIEPGVIVKAVGHRSINIIGTLIAKGTLENPIVFTSAKDAKYGSIGTGASSTDWGGIAFFSALQGNTLENCIVRFAEKGIVLGGGAVAPTLRNVSLTNGKYAAAIHIIHISSQPTKELTSELDRYANNQYSGVLVFGDVVGDLTLKNLGVHYLIDEDLKILAGSKLTIERGVVVKFVNHNSFNVAGKLIAQGSSKEPIVFTSVKDAKYGGSGANPNDWQGLRLSKTPQEISSVLEYCVIRYAEKAILAEQTAPNITNCIISNSIRGLELNDSTAKLRGNRLEFNFEIDLAIIGSFAPDLGSEKDAGKNTIASNTGFQIVNQTALSVPAKKNFWGSKDGPSKDKIKGLVDFEPWLTEDQALTYAIPILTPEPPPFPSITFGSFKLALSQGLNMIALPVKPEVPFTARSFAEKLEATILVRFDPKSQQFDAYVPPIVAGNGFEIAGGQGYIVNLLEDKKVLFTGSMWTNAPPLRAEGGGRRAELEELKNVDNVGNVGNVGNFFSVGNVGNLPGVWAFVVGGYINNVGANLVFAPTEPYAILARNLRTGNTIMGGQTHRSAPTSSYWTFALPMVNMNRQEVVRLGDKLEISLLEASGKVISGPIVKIVELDDIANAYTIVNLKIGDVTPRKSALLQNYPNPFNPETWIPYMLSDEAEVTISIYNVQGQLIRTLSLGHKPAGSYLIQDKAAYWDGRNDVGEYVSSGVYFYQLQAGKFRDVKRMVIAK